MGFTRLRKDRSKLFGSCKVNGIIQAGIRADTTMELASGAINLAE